MIDDATVQAALNRIRPFMQRDGGDIELLGVADNRARVRLTGNCAGCPSAAVTLYLAYLGITGSSTGLLLWPAVVLHLILTALLTRGSLHRS